MNKIVLALDPSGNFYEGKGTTGWCASRDGYIFRAGQISSAEHSTQMEYWAEVIKLIKDLKEEFYEITVVCEDYRLYASASQAQINSNLETPQLIGAIKWVCYRMKIPIVFQMAAEVKGRWSNEVLLKKGIIFRTRSNESFKLGQLILHRHSMDAVRHCLHYNTFKAKTRDPIKYKQTHKGEWKSYD